MPEADTGAEAGEPDQPPPGAVLVDQRYAPAVAQALVASGAFTVDLGLPRERWHRWKSGVLAPFGCDCGRLNTTPVHRRLIDGALTDSVRAHFPDADYIVGAATGALPWAKSVADRLDLPLAYLRSEPRGPTGGLVECSPGAAKCAVLIEDVVSGSGGARRAIAALHAESGMRVAGVQGIAAWSFPQPRTRAVAWPTRALTGHPQLLAAARSAELIDEAGRSRLSRFSQDPDQDPDTHAPPDDPDQNPRR